MAFWKKSRTPSWGGAATACAVRAARGGLGQNRGRAEQDGKGQAVKIRRALRGDMMLGAPFEQPLPAARRGRERAAHIQTVLHGLAVRTPARREMLLTLG